MRVAGAAYPTERKEAAVALVAEFDPDTIPLVERDGLYTGARQDPFTFSASLSDVPPGHYLLRVEAKSEAKGVEPVERRIPIEVR
jgi:hypothetical protein